MPSVPKELKGIVTPMRVDKKKRRKRISESQRKELKKKFLEEYKKDGMTLSKASDAVGFSRQVLYKWANADPEFAVEFEKLRSLKEHKSYKEYEKAHRHDEEYKKKFLELYSDDMYTVASALNEISPKLNDKDLAYWEKTDPDFKLKYHTLKARTRPVGALKDKIRKAISGEKKRQNQEKFLDIFRNCHFNITNACKTMGIKRSTVKGWCNENPDFRLELESAQDEKEDYVESKLFQLIEAGNMPATIFASKIMLNQPNFGRRHVYIEQPQRIEGKIEHKHKFDQDQLDAMVRGRQVDRAKYAKILEIEDPNIIDAEYTDEPRN